ncbi:MAG: TIGR02611 family protein [Pseudonocardia sp.]
MAGGQLGTTEDEERETGAFRRAVGRVVDGYQGFRSTVARNMVLNLAFRIAVGVVGIAVVVLGIIALPAPGPGWAIIFLGLGILATEFEGARRVLHWVRVRYLAWVHWLGRQRRATQLLVSTGILLLVAVCAWFVGAFALVASWLHIDWAWLHSPVSTFFGL